LQSNDEEFCFLCRTVRLWVRRGDGTDGE